MYTDVLMSTTKCFGLDNHTQSYTGYEYENIGGTSILNYKSLEITELWIGQHWISVWILRFYLELKTELDC